jgi:hypothetical protein
LDETSSSVTQALASPGKPLESALRQDMERRFGYDFSQVRVHTDATAAQSARDVNASAYTVGNDIVYGTGRYAPTAQHGQRLIAHELTHVVQQSGAISSPKVIQRSDGAGGSPGRPVGFGSGPHSYEHEIPSRWAKDPEPRKPILAPDECASPFSIPECQGARDPDIILHEPRRWSSLLYRCKRAIQGCVERAMFRLRY